MASSIILPDGTPTKWSPYLSKIYFLKFDDRHKFAVPVDLLAPYEKLTQQLFKPPTTDNIFKGYVEMYPGQPPSHDFQLVRIPREAGHILVHYLYTGAYEHLSAPADSRSDSELKNSPLQLSICVHGAARKYGISGLEELALCKLNGMADQHEPLDVLMAVYEAYKILGVDEDWLPNFVTAQLERLFEDPHVLNQAGLLELLKVNSHVGQVITENMLKLCCSRMELLTPAASTVGDDAPGT